LKYLGIHVVKPGSNIWDIHYTLLKDYFENKGVSLSSRSDEPNEFGYSSGIGKILKFSEKLVYIFNIQTKTFDPNLDMIEPDSIIVIYNMNQIFDLLNKLDYSKIDRIEFDGETIWLPPM